MEHQTKSIADLRPCSTRLRSIGLNSPIRFVSLDRSIVVTRGDALRSAQRLPLAIILRAFGAIRIARAQSEARGEWRGLLIAEFSAGLLYTRAIRTCGRALRYAPLVDPAANDVIGIALLECLHALGAAGRRLWACCGSQECCQTD